MLKRVYEGEGKSSVKSDIARDCTMSARGTVTLGAVGSEREQAQTSNKSKAGEMETDNR